MNALVTAMLILWFYKWILLACVKSWIMLLRRFSYLPLVIPNPYIPFLIESSAFLESLACVLVALLLRQDLQLLCLCLKHYIRLTLGESLLAVFPHLIWREQLSLNLLPRLYLHDLHNLWNWKVSLRISLLIINFSYLPVRRISNSHILLYPHVLALRDLLNEHLRIHEINGIFTVSKWVKILFRVVFLHDAKESSFCLIGKELVMNDLQGVTYEIVLLSQSSEWGQNRVINSLNQDDLLKWIEFNQFIWVSVPDNDPMLLLLLLQSDLLSC